MKSTKKTQEFIKNYYEIDDNGKIKPVRFVGSFEDEEPVNKGFVKLWHNMRGRKEILPSLDIDLFFYLIYRSDSRNRGLIYMKNLAKLYKTTPQRISRHIQTLAACDLIKIKRTGHYIINPDYIFKGIPKDRKSLVDYYRNCTFEWK